MKTIIAASVILLTLAGCSSHHDKAVQAKRPPASPTSCAPSDDSCIPPDHPATTSAPVPVLEVGKAIHLQLPTDDGVVQTDLTLTGLKKKGRELCWGFKLRNVDTKPLSGLDLSWRWIGVDGQEADTDPGTSGQCDELGHEYAGMDQPAPGPGHYVTGYYGFGIPSKPGAVEVTDSQDSPLFRLNYEPQSKQVTLNQNGQ